MLVCPVCCTGQGWVYCLPNAFVRFRLGYSCTCVDRGLALVLFELVLAPQGTSLCACSPSHLGIPHCGRSAGFVSDALAIHRVGSCGIVHT